MPGDTEPDYQETPRDEFSFDWDETTQLYFHASSGFYHDPIAGWFYSSTDGLYYKFENGSYVLLECSGKVNNECEREIFVDNPLQDESFTHVEGNVYENLYSSPPANDSESCQHYGVAVDESNLGYTECSSIQEPENPPAPSEWLEETLINLYLSGSNRAIDALDEPVTGLKMDINNDNCKPEEGDPITEGHCGLADPDASRDEENWRAQYGQVVHSREEPMLDFHAVDLWGWEVVKGSRKVGKGQEARLVGKLVKQSAKSHPSMPSSCSRFRTAPICEVHLDLQASQTYRDRAAERRNLHGGFGVGPGQKSSLFGDVGGSSSLVSTSTEEAAAEALSMSFGVGSYARKILENMGWKEGEALGNTTKGLVEPIKAVGNMGNAGLGWPQGRIKLP